MAAHFFGYYYGAEPEAMFRHTCKRQGWNTPKHLVVQDSGKTLAQELFAKVEIRPVTFTGWWRRSLTLTRHDPRRSGPARITPGRSIRIAAQVAAPEKGGGPPDFFHPQPTEEDAMNHDEKAIEKEIQDKGFERASPQPRLSTPRSFGEQFYVFPNTTLTVCALTLRNGFHRHR